MKLILHLDIFKAISSVIKTDYRIAFILRSTD